MQSLLEARAVRQRVPGRDVHLLFLLEREAAAPGWCRQEEKEQQVLWGH